MINQNSFLSIAQNQKRLRCEKFLEEMEKVVPWSAFQAEIEPHYTEKETGRKQMDLVMMLKIHFLQQWYSLSDREAEEMIYDRNSFQKFLGIDLQMTQTRKGNQWYFGMKAHSGVDAKSGLVHSMETTPAKTNDRVPFKKLLHGKEKAIFGDKAYAKQSDKRACRKNGIFWAVKDRPSFKHPLSAAQRKRNKKFGSIRSKVEHPFRILKCQWGHVKVRHKGLFKNTMQLFSLFALANLFCIRKKLLFQI